MLGGELLGAYCLSEPQSGLRRRGAAHPGDHGRRRRLRGHRHQGVDHPRRSGRLLRPLGPHRRTTAPRGISCLLADGEHAGLSCRSRPRSKMGLRASPHRADPPRRRARPGRPADRRGGRRASRSRCAALDGGRLGIAACAVGLAQAALDYAVAYAKERQQFGRPIADFQGAAVHARRHGDRGRGGPGAVPRRRPAQRRAASRSAPQAAMAKLFATDTAMRVTTDAVQVLGGYGYVERLPGRAVHARGEGAADRRGHQPDPAHGHRTALTQGLSARAGRFCAVEDLDREIVRLLTGDGRMSYTDLGRATGLSTSAVHQRVRRLEQRGVIKGYARGRRPRRRRPAAHRVRLDHAARPVPARRRARAAGRAARRSRPATRWPATSPTSSWSAWQSPIALEALLQEIRGRGQRAHAHHGRAVHAVRRPLGRLLRPRRDHAHMVVG